MVLQENKQMTHSHLLRKMLLVCSILVVPASAVAQGTQADYERAAGMRGKMQGLATNIPSSVTAIENTSRFWYRKSVKGGNEFVLVDAETQAKRPAFDHQKLADTLSTATGQKYTAVTLPFQTITFLDNERAIEFAAAGSMWKCDLSSYVCTKGTAAPFAGQRGGGGPEFDELDEYNGGFNSLTLEAAPEVLEPPVFFAQGQRGQRGQPQPAQTVQTPPYRGEGQIGFGTGANLLQPVGQTTMPPVEQPKASPDGKWEAYVNNYYVFIRAKGQNQGTPLSFDGSEGDRYTLRSLSWSPDSKYLAAYRVRPGYHRKIQYVQTSPADQVQPKYLQR